MLSRTQSQIAGWLPEMDRFIPVALEKARSRIRGDHVNKSDEILTQAKGIIVHKYRRFAKSMSKEFLVQRIHALNAVLPPDEAIWIAIPPARQELPPMPQTLVPVVPQQPTANDGLFDVLKGLLHAQQEANTLQQMMFDQIVRLNNNLERQEVLAIENSGNMKSLLEYYAKREKHNDRSHLSRKEAAPIKEPVLRWNGRVCAVGREDICFGETWKKISAQHLTQMEVDWKELFEFLQHKWEHNHSFNGGSVAIYGRDVSAEDLQILFYRLNFERIVWYRSSSSDELTSDDLGQVDPRNGRIAIIVQKGVSVGAIQKLKRKCEEARIHQYTMGSDALRVSSHASLIAQFFVEKMFWPEASELARSKTKNRLHGRMPMLHGSTNNN